MGALSEQSLQYSSPWESWWCWCMGKGREGVLRPFGILLFTFGANAVFFHCFYNLVFPSLIIVYCFLTGRNYTLIHLPEHAHFLLVVVRDTLLVYNFPCEGCHGNTIYCIPGLICAQTQNNVQIHKLLLPYGLLLLALILLLLLDTCFIHQRVKKTPFLHLILYAERWDV